MIESYIDGPVAVLHIEHDGVATQFAPAPDNTESAVTCGHHPGQIYRPHFKVAGHWNRLFHDRRVQDSRNDHLLSAFQKYGTWLSIRLANSFSQLARSQVGSLRQVPTCD